MNGFSLHIEPPSYVIARVKPVPESADTKHCPSPDPQGSSVIYSVTSADNLCTQFGPRSRPTERRPLSGSKLFDGVGERIFLKKLILKKVSRWQQKA